MTQIFFEETGIELKPSEGDKSWEDLAKHNYGDLNRKLKLYKGDLEIAKSFSEGR